MTPITTNSQFSNGVCAAFGGFTATVQAVTPQSVSVPFTLPVGVPFSIQ